ncbi:hypothetical protein V1514DRAFT_304699 [Lipomyces japonicus]|uniref:uncharacterized protein n=1 Tax=Lipomyces japonicus TaxID=56871 RepID=UPI0034CF6D75
MSLSPLRIYNLLFPKYPEPAELSSTVSVDASSKPIRIGILGAAAIAPKAVINPAKLMPDVAVIWTVAARNKEKAEEYASKYGIPHVHDNYDQLLDDPEVDAVYIPLPNGLHAEWTIKAIDRKKPVLLEKPVTSNADQAAKLFAYAEDKNVLITEAVHWWYHPAAKAVKAIVSDAEEFGEIEAVEASLCTNFRFSNGNIRFNYDLAGGSVMDMGFYPISWTRYFLNEDPVTALKKGLITDPRDDRVDTYANVEFSFASNEKKKATIYTGMITPVTTLWKLGIIPKVIIKSSKKNLVYTLPLLPHVYHNVSVKDNVTGKITNTSYFEPGKETWSTYAYQLEAFAKAVRGKDVKLYSHEDSVANMVAIDKAYEALGLPLRK